MRSETVKMGVGGRQAEMKIVVLGTELVLEP